jgi:C_GCAxxG_C_C family probable redox protein
VFSAVAEGMGMDYDTAVKVSAGFGGGMYLGSVCGAVTGGIMAIGLKHGGAGREAGMRTARLVREYADRFKALHKSINCPDLTGVDLGELDPMNHPEVMKELMAKGTFAGCPGFVKDSVTILEEILNEPPRRG